MSASLLLLAALQIAVVQEARCSRDHCASIDASPCKLLVHGTVHSLTTDGSILVQTSGETLHDMYAANECWTNSGTVLQLKRAPDVANGGKDKCLDVQVRSDYIFCVRNVSRHNCPELVPRVKPAKGHEIPHVMTKRQMSGNCIAHH